MPFNRKIRRALTKKNKHVIGLNQLQAQLNDLADMIDGDEIINNVLMPAAMTARDEIKDTAPRGSGGHPPGQLTIREATFAARGDPSKDRRGPSVLFGVNAKKAPQAFWMEYGTSKIPGGRPYFRVARAAVRPTLAQMIADGTQRLIDEAVK